MAELAAKSMAASFEWDPIWLDSKEQDASFTLYESGGPGTHVGAFYVKAGDTEDPTKWVTESISALNASNGAAVSARRQLAIATRGFLIGYTYTSGTGTVAGSYSIKRR